LKPTIAIIHGACGNPEENWFPWLKAKLEKRGFRVIAPKFPTPEGQNLGNWIAEMNAAIPNSGNELILIGHSIGCAFALQYIARTENRIRGAFLVAGFGGKIGKKIFDSVNASFLGSFDWKKIREKCPKFFVYHADNDPYVPLSFGEGLAKSLGAELRIVKGAGHFNAQAGYDKFELLLKDILEFAGESK